MSTISDERDAGQLFTVREVARRLRLSRAAVYRRLAAGELVAIRLGREPSGPLRVRLDELDRYLEQGSSRRGGREIATRLHSEA